MRPNDQNFVVDPASRMTATNQFTNKNVERPGGTFSYARTERTSYMPNEFNRINSGGSLAYPSGTGFSQPGYDTEFKQPKSYPAPTPQQFPSQGLGSNFDTSAPAPFMPRSKYLSTLTSQNSSKPMKMNMNFQNMSVPQPQSYESRPEPMKYNAPRDFTQMPSNSALMQSYNLMKMSSEVTKTQGAPQFMNQDRKNNYFQPAPQKQTPPQQQPNFNMGTYGPQRITPAGPVGHEQRDDNNFLSNISPADMGIPMDVVGAQGSPPRQMNAENRLGSPNRNQHDFPPFDEVFKSKNTNKGSENNQAPAEIPYDEQPVGGGNSNPPAMPQNDFSQPAENKQSEAFVVDFNEPAESESQKEAPAEAPPQDQAEVVHEHPPHDPNVFNVDEIQIKPKQQLTFEELLEKELNDKENKADALPKDDDRVIRKPKKEFLKRTSKKTQLPKDKQGGKKYKYYADHFGKKKNSSNPNNTNSGSEVEKSDCAKPTKQASENPDNEHKNDHLKDEDTEPKTFLSKGAGLGGGKGKTENSANENTSHKQDDDDQDQIPSDNNQIRSRRGRKTRGPGINTSGSHKQDDRDNSLEEFEVLEENIQNEDKNNGYQVIKKNFHTTSKKGKAKKAEAASEGPKKAGNSHNSGVNENGAERQRLAKEKKEFKKQKDKFESEKLAFERKKRDLDKQKMEFEKTKETEMKKINVERQKIEKEKRAFHRQNDKKKEDSELTEKLYKEIDLLQDEIRKKDNKNNKLEDEVRELHNLVSEYEEKIYYLEDQLQASEDQLQANEDKRVESSVQLEKEKPITKLESKIPRASKPVEDKTRIEKRFIKNSAHEEVSVGLGDEFKDFEDEEDDQDYISYQENGQQNVDNEGEEGEMDEENLDDFSLIFLEKYHGGENENAEIVQESEGTKGKIFRLYSNEKREILFTNGVKKEIFPDGYSIVYFANDDIKQTYPDGRTVYYFADAGTAQTTLPDGIKIYKFNNDQIEKHYTDGTKEINFPDGTVKYIFGPSDEESIFSDGTVQRLTPDGLKVVEYPSGQKDIVYPDGTKERQYPSGKVKKMNPDGVIKSYKADDN